MTKLEEVARAIDPGAFSGLWHADGTCEECDYNRNEARRKARAALTAMREPSKGMTDAGEESFDWDSSDTSGSYFIRNADAGKCWYAMIDAALSGEG